MMDIRTYLDRIDFNNTIAPDINTLRGLQTAHMLTVPFENLDITLKRPIRLSEQDLWQKIVVHKRGGFCYELNGLFAWLLKQIGFNVTYLNARVYEKDGSLGPDFDHLALLVKIPGLGGRWLADVGFGDTFTEPLSFETMQEQAQGLRAYRLEEQSGHFTVWNSGYDGKWERQYNFDLTAHQFPVEYEAMCKYHQTSPQSSFTKGRLISQATPDGRITLDDEKLSITEDGRRRVIPLMDENEFERLLKERFGIAL